MTDHFEHILLDPCSLSQLKSSFQAAGASARAANQLLDVYKKYALTIAERYTLACYEAVQSHTSSKSRDSEQKIYTSFLKDRYMKLLSKWRDDMMGVITARYGSQKSHQLRNNATKPKIEFNKDFVPVLEEFYAQNNFPSRIDKMSLAQKSGMTYKQIDIWFQNRRNRNLKNVKSQRELSQEKILSAGSLGRCRDTKSTQKPSIFSLPCPDFPSITAYPLHNLDTSAGDKKRQLETQWYRKPANKSIDYSALSVSELTQSFANLSVNDDEIRSDLSGSAGKAYNTEDGLNPWIVRPYPAPLPFLVQPLKRQINSCPSMVTQLQHPRCNKSRKKKVSQLPKRTPSALVQKDVPSSFQGNSLDKYASESFGYSSSSFSPSASIDSLPALSRCPSESSSLVSSDDDDYQVPSPSQLPKDSLGLYLESHMNSLSDYPSESWLALQDDSDISHFDFTCTVPHLQSMKGISVAL